MQLVKQLLFFTFIIISFLPVSGRSIHRSYNPTIPYIIVTGLNQSETIKQKSCRKLKSNKLQNKFLRLKTLKRPYENSGFKKHMLPKGKIKFRKTDDTVQSDTLKKENEHLLEEILSGSKKFTDFTVLKDTDFNYNTLSGLVVLKYKKFPFVLKLFIEHPHTFIDPLSRSLVAGCIFVLSGNTRHLSGFTRIHNKETARKALAKDPEYRYYLDFPRKWYWLPESQPYLNIKWHDSHHDYYETIKIPSFYGIVCDFIETDKVVQKKEIHTLRQISIDVANYLRNIIDSHVDNFIPELGSNKIVIIDTEHFPTVAGLEKEMNANGYIQWHFELMGKYMKTAWFRSKQQRIKDQSKM